MNEYSPHTIEPKWQRHWEEQGYFFAREEANKKKWYSLIEFPYPSGAGLHVGHVRPYVGLDLISRKKRMEGYSVLYPIGWDAFGLPTENYAIKHKVHPRKATEDNVANFKRQIQSLGVSFDWSREINTTNPSYYKWTQWIFLQLLKHGLAYQAEMPINWCPSCKIGLANEEVIDGACERCGSGTTRRMMKQWMLAITKYADRLIDDLATVDYLPRVATQQVNWIGRSEGMNIAFPIVGTDDYVEIFTKFPETIFGVTFMVLSPEHPLLQKYADRITNRGDVDAYIRQAKAKNDLERTDLAKEKTGVAVEGIRVTNPVNNQEVPVWVGDFVLGHFGTGAVMAVPGHDRRDFAFATTFGLPVVRVITPTNGESGPIDSLEKVVEEGTMVNSGFLDGLDAQTEAKEKIKESIVENGWGRSVTQFKLRDWVFSRQHYWGEPIPVVHCETCGVVPVPENQLPITLPDVEQYEPTETGESPLAAMVEWVHTACPKCGGPAKRETDTMPNWAGSSWYYLRYADPQNDTAFASKERLEYWLPVDLYNGGMEHTTLHLLYSRFWHKFLFDIGVVPQPEPYLRRRSHGIVLANDGRKMSKSWGNVISPDDIVGPYGADTLRVYEMFMGPFDEMIAWDENGVRGVRRFLDRVWRLQGSIGATDDPAVLRAVHYCIQKVGDDIDAMKFNTAVSQLMICANAIEAGAGITKETFEKFVVILSPLAPHMAEELWEILGHSKSITQERWPEADGALLQSDSMTIAIQVNGTMRDLVELSSGSTEEQVKESALSSEKVRKCVAGAEIVKVIYVPQRILNIVTK